MGNTNELEDARLLEKIKKAVPELYMLEHHTIKNKPITFYIEGHDTNKPNEFDPIAVKHRPWQPQIINDHHPNLVIEKSRQVGGSELSIGKIIHFLDYYSPVSVMYTFPRFKQLKSFVAQRLDPLFKNNKYYQSLLDKNTNNQTLKKIRGSYLNLNSAFSSAMGESQAIDALYLDEYDRMKDNVELAFQESMSSSVYKLLRRWSTPTIPGRGVDKVFQNSDQNYWVHKCPKCGHDQILTLEDNIIQIDKNGVDLETNQIRKGTFSFVCSKCHEPLDRWYNGRWVAKYPNRTQNNDGIRGYHISQLNCVWHTADSIMQRQFDYDSKQLFYNYVIGKAYATGGLIVNIKDIMDAKRFEKPIISREGYEKISVGIDWGTRNWCVVLGLKANGKVDLLNLWMFRDNQKVPLMPVKSIAAYITPYVPDLIIADWGFGADRNSYLMQTFKGKTWSCRFMEYKDASQPIDKWNENSRIVVVDKTLKMQRMLHTIKARGIGMWRIDDKLKVFAKHLSNVRIMDQEDGDGVIYQIATRIGDDHLACALCYALIGIEKIINPYRQREQYYL